MEKNNVPKRIVLIGAGNVATHLALAIHAAGHQVVQIYSRTMQSADVLSQLVGAESCTDLLLLQKADYYIYAVSDSALVAVVAQVTQFGGIHVHTTGSVDMTVFESKFQNYGVLYPLQTFSKAKKIDFRSVPLFLEASSEFVLHELQSFALSVSDICKVASSEQRIKLHVAAVFACNFGNYFYTLASGLLEKEGLSFDVLKPLIDETAHKITELQPYDAQTGPARRNDKDTMNKHLKMLEGTDLKDLYALISERIVNLYQPKITS